MSNQITVGNREVIGAGTIISERDEVITIPVQTPPPPAIGIDRMLLKIIFKTDPADRQGAVHLQGDSKSIPPTITVTLTNWSGAGTGLPTTEIATRDSDGSKIYLALYAHFLGSNPLPPTRVVSYVLSVEK